MIKLTTPEGRTVYVSPKAIAYVQEAGASSQWHGIRCYIKCFDGKTIECRETADQVNTTIAAAADQVNTTAAAAERGEA